MPYVRLSRKPALDWAAVWRDVLLPWDLEETPLQIKTDSTLGSDEEINVQMHKNDRSYISRAGAPYYGKSCQYNPRWRWIRSGRLPKLKTAFTITCNNVEVLNYPFADSSRPTYCSPQWGGDVVGNIYFYSAMLPSQQDTASDFYRAESPCPAFTVEGSTQGNWTASPTGTTVTIECVATLILASYFHKTFNWTPRNVTSSWFRHYSNFRFRAPLSLNYKTGYSTKRRERSILPWRLHPVCYADCNPPVYQFRDLYTSVHHPPLRDSRPPNRSHNTWSGTRNKPSEGRAPQLDMFHSPICEGRGIDMIRFLFFTAALCGTVVPTDWTAVGRDVYILWDLEETPLQIKTDSTLGSDEEINVQMHKNDRSYISRVGIKFSSTMQYAIGWCTIIWQELPVQPPVEVDKIWTITKTKTAFTITCNNVEVLNYLFADSSRTEYCAPQWGGDVVGNIYYYSAIGPSQQDTASDFYRAESPCPAFTVEGSTQGNWTASPTGTTVTIECVATLILVGSATLTCQGDGSWSSDIPQCDEIDRPLLVLPGSAYRSRAPLNKTILVIHCPRVLYHNVFFPL
eukprot:sb/3463460/